jgi:hypothetical protein
MININNNIINQQTNKTNMVVISNNKITPLQKTKFTNHNHIIRYTIKSITLTH